MNRWIQTPLAAIRRFLQALGRGLVSAIVVAIVLLPLVLAVTQWGGVGNLFASDKRKVGDVAAMNVRAIDRTSQPIKPFQQPLITVTFDDGWESIYTSGLPLFQQYGIPTTQYILSGVTDQANYMSISQVKAMQQAGHEIACHSIDHADLTKLTADRLQAELRDCKKFYEGKLGLQVNHFASPYGSSNAQTIAAIRQVYQSHRDTTGDITTNDVDEVDINTDRNFDRYNIHAISIRRETTIEQLQQAINYTIANNGWLVLNYHDVNDTDSAYGVDHATLERQLAAVSRANARIVTIGQVMDVLKAQNR